MCGIAGILRYKQSVTPEDLAAVQQMMAAQIHRGPDGEGIVAVGKLQPELTDMLPAWSRVNAPNVASSVVLGHRRLAIIDLSDAARQPLSNEDRTVWLTYNGEIYNYRTLRDELAHAGHRFASQTDSEVIVHGYEEWGIEELLGRLRGMFAFALYDAREDRSKRLAQEVQLILARDRFGIKPLYYAQQTYGILFASEVRALLAKGLVSSDMDSRALIRFLQLGSVPMPLTTVKNIQGLPAGQYAIVGHEGVQLRSYWRLSSVLTGAAMNSAGQSEALALDTTRALLDEAVGLHLLSDVPLGTFLSGGTDSSSLVMLAIPHRTTPLTTLSVGFAEAEYDESYYARLVAAQYHTCHHETVLHSIDCFSALPQILQTMDQPSTDGINTYFVARAAKEAGLTVALAGIGGDEVFAGYPHLRHGSGLMQLHAVWATLPRLVRKALIASAVHIGGLVQKTGREKLPYAESATPDGLYFLIRGFFPSRQIQELLGIDEREIAALPPLVSYDNEAIPSGYYALLLYEFTLYLQGQLLKDVDNMGMAHSLEIRVPLLDHRLVEYVLSLPLAMTHGRGMNKALLVRALGDGLPRAVWDRPKQGFTFPFSQWLRQHGEELEASTKRSQILQKRMVENVWREFRAGRMHWSRPWALVVLSWFTANRNVN